ncbi:hypothetical protein, partial [Klebsiella pneumoniae]|uniref:hypothetical protein n=1 Tax=Klebsiella pneumoniae TaxID=573 RepID=UPI00272F922A
GTPAQIERATQLLARHLGPIAGVLVKRAARDGADLNQFGALLAAQIDDPVIRSRFLADLGKTG